MVGISMGTHCAQIRFHERGFIISLKDNIIVGVNEDFSSTPRYLDDLQYICYPNFY